MSEQDEQVPGRETLRKWVHPEIQNCWGTIASCYYGHNSETKHWIIPVSSQFAQLFAILYVLTGYYFWLLLEQSSSFSWVNFTFPLGYLWSLQCSEKITFPLLPLFSILNLANFNFHSLLKHVYNALWKKLLCFSYNSGFCSLTFYIISIVINQIFMKL